MPGGMIHAAFNDGQSDGKVLWNYAPDWPCDAESTARNVRDRSVPTTIRIPCFWVSGVARDTDRWPGSHRTGSLLKLRNRRRYGRSGLPFALGESSKGR
jgi:hypothetical protein